MSIQPTTPGPPGTPRGARQFQYYDDWKSAVLECWRCGWKGTFNEGLVEAFDQLMDSTCPKCDGDAPMLAIVNYPTLEESRQNWSRLSPSEQAGIAAREAFVRRFEQERLKSPDQLPDIEGAELVLVWDFVSTISEGAKTVLRHADTEIWREPALFEGADRFEEIVSILRTKYGDRITDLVPTDESQLYLLGDRSSSRARVDRARGSLGAALAPRV